MTNIRLKMIITLILAIVILAGTSYSQNRTRYITGAGQSRELVEYISESGFRIEITNTGNLVGLESPIGFDYLERRTTREGYLLSYTTPDGVNRTVYNIYSLRSNSITNSRPDLIPVSFDGPAAGSSFANGTLVTAKVVVRTIDNQLELAHIFTWRAGTGQVSISTEITNINPTAQVELRAFNRIIDLNIGLGSTNSRVEQWHIDPPDQENGNTLIASYCNCPPPVPRPPIGFANISLQGSPMLQSAMIQNTQQLSESLAGRAGTSLPDGSIGDNLGVLGWQNSVVLSPQDKSSFTTNLSVITATN